MEKGKSCGKICHFLSKIIILRSFDFKIEKVIGNRGTIEINPRMLMAKETSITGVTLFTSDEVQIKSEFKNQYLIHAF